MQTKDALTKYAVSSKDLIPMLCYWVRKLNKKQSPFCGLMPPSPPIGPGGSVGTILPSGLVRTPDTPPVPSPPPGISPGALVSGKPSLPVIGFPSAPVMTFGGIAVAMLPSGFVTGLPLSSVTGMTPGFTVTTLPSGVVIGLPSGPITIPPPPGTTVTGLPSGYVSGFPSGPVTIGEGVVMIPSGGNDVGRIISGLPTHKALYLSGEKETKCERCILE